MRPEPEPGGCFYEPAIALGLVALGWVGAFVWIMPST